MPGTGTRPDPEPAPETPVGAKTRRPRRFAARVRRLRTSPAAVLAVALSDKQRGLKGLAVFVSFCLAAALFPAVASAHEATTEEYTYQVEVEKTREVPAYKWVTERVRVAPFSKPKTVAVHNYENRRVRVAPYSKPKTVVAYNYENRRVRVAPYTKVVQLQVYNYENRRSCHNLGCWTTRVRVAPFSKPKTVAAYNYENRRVRVAPYNKVVQLRVYNYENRRVRVAPYTKVVQVAVYNYENVTKKVPDGTRTETYTETQTRTGTRTRHEPRHPSHCTSTEYAKTYPQDCRPQRPTPTPTAKPAGGFRGLMGDLADLPGDILTGHRTEIAEIVTKVTINGVKYIIKGGKAFIELASHLKGQARDAVERAARVYMENLYRKSRAAFDVLCTGPGQVLSAAVAGYALAQTAIAASATAALAASGVTIVVAGAPAIVAIGAAAISGLVIWAGCEYVIDKILDDSDGSEDQGDGDNEDTEGEVVPRSGPSRRGGSRSETAPAPTPSATATPNPTPTTAPTPHPDHQEPPAEYSRKLCNRIGRYSFCHYRTPDGWTQRTHVD